MIDQEHEWAANEVTKGLWEAVYGAPPVEADNFTHEFELLMEHIRCHVAKYLTEQAPSYMGQEALDRLVLSSYLTTVEMQFTSRLEKALDDPSVVDLDEPLTSFYLGDINPSIPALSNYIDHAILPLFWEGSNVTNWYTVSSNYMNLVKGVYNDQLSIPSVPIINVEYFGASSGEWVAEDSVAEQFAAFAYHGIRNVWLANFTYGQGAQGTEYDSDAPYARVVRSYDPVAFPRDGMLGYVELSLPMPTGFLWRQPLPINVQDLPTEARQLIALGGKNIRVYNELGHRLPVDNSGVVGKGEDASGTLFYQYSGGIGAHSKVRLYLGNAAFDTPPVDSTYGQYAVYPSDCILFCPDGITDRTSNENHFTTFGTITAGDTVGPKELLATYFNGSSYASQAFTKSPLAPINFFALAKSTSLTTDQSILVAGVQGSGNNFLQTKFSGTVTDDPVSLTIRESTSGTASAGTYQNDTWCSVGGYYIGGTNQRVFFNGTTTAGNTANINPSGIDHLAIGARLSSSNTEFLTGALALVTVNSNFKTSPWQTYMYNAYLTSFYTSSTWNEL